jgi:hypothetical protein
LCVLDADGRPTSNLKYASRRLPAWNDVEFDRDALSEALLWLHDPKWPSLCEWINMVYGSSRAAAFSYLAYLPEAVRVEAFAGTEAQPGTVEAPALLPSGTRTNKAENAQEACKQWMLAQIESKWQPQTKPSAYEIAKKAVKEIGPLSQRAFDIVWAVNAPPEWKKPGAKKREQQELPQS